MTRIFSTLSPLSLSLSLSLMYIKQTGLPKPQPDHAMIMVKFATDCMAKMNRIVCSSSLVDTLGNDTADLTMRVGLHSGPVTAGVLRGQKSRFQLFGDSVNTAARMESCGIKDKIHISQSTADLLILANKSHWLTPRQDIIEAKGKGKMQTYWVNRKTTTVTASQASSKHLTNLSSSGGASGDGGGDDTEVDFSERNWKDDETGLLAE